VKVDILLKLIFYMERKKNQIKNKIETWGRKKQYSYNNLRDNYEQLWKEEDFELRINQNNKYLIKHDPIFDKILELHCFAYKEAKKYGFWIANPFTPREDIGIK